MKRCGTGRAAVFLETDSVTWTAPALGERRKSDMLQMRCLDHGDAVTLMHAGGIL